MATPRERVPKTENGVDAPRNVYVRTYNYTGLATPKSWTLTFYNRARLKLNYLLKTVFYQVTTFFLTELNFIKKYCML